MPDANRELRTRRARGAGEAGRLLAEAGTVVEVDPDVAHALGATEEDCLDLEDALESMWDLEGEGPDDA